MTRLLLCVAAALVLGGCGSPRPRATSPLGQRCLDVCERKYDRCTSECKVGDGGCTLQCQFAFRDCDNACPGVEPRK